MTDALRFERVRLRTLRSTYWLAASALLLNIAIAVTIALLSRNDPHTPDFVGMAITGGGPSITVPFAGVFLAALGVLATGHEYRYGTIQPTLTAVPQRSTLLFAKLVVLVAAALAVTVVSLVANAAAALVVWGTVPGLSDWPLNDAIPGYLGLVLLWTVLGAALGQLFRGVPAALVVLLTVPLIVEQLIFSLSFVPSLDWLMPVVRFLPFTAGRELIGLGGESDVEMFGRWASGGVFAAFVAIVLAVGWTLFARRDA